MIVAAKLAAAQGISTRPGMDGSLEGQGKQDTQVKTNGEVRDVTTENNDKHKKEEEIKRKKEEEEKAKETKIQDKSRPVSSTPVPGTPWYYIYNLFHVKFLSATIFVGVSYGPEMGVYFSIIHHLEHQFGKDRKI